MSEARGAVDVDLPHADISDRRENGTGFRAYTYTLLVAGTVGAALLWWRSPLVWDVRLLWILPALMVGFLLAERLAINIDVRGGVSWTISFTEVPMVVGLLAAPFQTVLLAHVLAGVGTLLARRVHDRAAYNAGVMLIEVDSAFLVAHLVNAALSGTVPWAGAFTGALAVPFTSTLFAVFALGMLGQRMRAASALRLIGRVLVFKPGGTAKLPVAKLSTAPLNPPAESFSTAQVDSGRVLYTQHCYRCHGAGAQSAGVLPDLRRSAALSNRSLWHAILIDGALEPAGMASFGKWLTADQAEAIRAYVALKARIAAQQSKP